jgi:hypothetical protein
MIKAKERSRRILVRSKSIYSLERSIKYQKKFLNMPLCSLLSYKYLFFQTTSVVPFDMA